MLTNERACFLIKPEYIDNLGIFLTIYVHILGFARLDF